MSRTALTSVPVHNLLAKRWSTRAFDATHEVSEEQLAALLEAARWAPSANNMQPWRFIVARRGEDAFKAIFDTLAGGNQIWAGNSSALIVAVAKTEHDGTQNAYAGYDLGQAVAHLSVQAAAENLYTHQLGGFDRQAIAEAFGLTEDLQPTVVIAIGDIADEHDLPEALAAREVAPRERLSVDDLLIAVED